MDRAWFCAYGLVLYIPVILLLGISSYINEKPRNDKPIHNVQTPVKNLHETKTGQNKVITQGNSAVYSYGKDYPIFDDYYKGKPSKEANSAELNRYSIYRKLLADKTSHNAHKTVVMNADEEKKWIRSQITGRLSSTFTRRVN
jgi:hypothetical protein